MPPDDPIPFPRPWAELTGGCGRLHCTCGHVIPIDRLHEPIDCPRCGRVWQLLAEVRLASHDDPGRSPDPDE